MNLTTIIVTIISIIILIYIAIKIVWYFKKFGLVTTIKKLIQKAEEIFQYKDNANKLKYVVDIIYGQLPIYLKTVITRENVTDFIEAVYKDFKKTLDKIIEESKKGE